MLLAKIGANTTMVSAGLLHDTTDDSFLDYDYIFHMFGANVAHLVEGVCTFSSPFVLLVLFVHRLMLVHDFSKRKTENKCLMQASMALL